MRSYIIIAICSLICGCSVNNNFTGKYMSKNNPNYIQLRRDSTFIFEYRALHLYEHSTGAWQKKEKNSIVLNSKIKSTILPLSVALINETNDYNTISFKLNIIRNESLADYRCGLYINDKLYCLRSCDSAALMHVNIPIYSMHFILIKEPRVFNSTYVALPLMTEKYNPTLEKGNRPEVTVNLNDNYFYYKAFNNEMLKVMRNGLKLFNSSTKKWETLLKAPNDTKLFSRYNDQSTGLNVFP
jgi:hypothetical protein